MLCSRAVLDRPTSPGCHDDFRPAGGPVDWGKDAAGLFAGFVLATLTTPVGVSGAVFLLPVQLSILGVPSPQITPTNLLYNVISGPGGLLRFCRRDQFNRELATRLIAGSAPGVVLGAVIRVYVAADPDTFRLLAAAVLGPVGLYILARTNGPPRPPEATEPSRAFSAARITGLAFVVGVIGGIYGIGGGEVLDRSHPGGGRRWRSRSWPRRLWLRRG